MTPDEVDAWAARQRIALDARMEGLAARMRMALRKSLGLGPERAPWDEPNENEGA